MRSYALCDSFSFFEGRILEANTNKIFEEKMASVKYRKKEKSENPIIETKKQESEAVKEMPKIVSQSQQDPRETVVNEIAESPAEGEQLIDCIRVEDKENLVEIKLIKKRNRLSKVVFIFNGMDLRPNTYAGANSGVSYFNLLKLTKKKAE